MRFPLRLPTLASTFQPKPQFTSQVPADDGDDPLQPLPGAPPIRGPVFNGFPQPQVVNPQAAPMQQSDAAQAPGRAPVQAPAAQPAPPERRSAVGAAVSSRCLSLTS